MEIILNRNLKRSPTNHRQVSGLFGQLELVRLHKQEKQMAEEDKVVRRQLHARRVDPLQRLILKKQPNQHLANKEIHDSQNHQGRLQRFGSHLLLHFRKRLS